MRFHELHVSTKVSQALSLLAEAKSRDTGRIITPDEIADKMLRQVVKEKYPEVTPGSDKYMECAAHLATVLAALVAAVTLIVGGCQFSKTQQQEREKKAIELFLKFNEQKEKLAAKPVTGDAAYWRSNALLATTEAIFKLTRGDKGWEETVSWMLKEQVPFLLQTKGFNCGTFAEDFLKLMQKAAPDLKCKDG